MRRQIFQLKVSLADVTPPVWRRVLVPGGYTLDRVHRVFQSVLGWQNCHLHSFDIDGAQYGVPDPEGELTLRDELDTRLDAVATKGGRFLYTYDFGDWWEHDVTVEDVFGADPEERYPVCSAGEGACPPEDVGGPFGYRQFLAAMADPGHPEHDSLRAWLGRPFEPSSFDPGRASTLARWLS
ncbi:plasmid pRiA4b ORF-3 family protein [Micromonospora sp. WMMD1102]|uniref:plasmid pRiA4b ORF-3 family protein n=1 Tax=Micromonospora sp. WMMD1102 TaxID=3016105 RepID=UPI0024156137|nr:plasmid pRiA4b ORF-3 family protein [Micromonospora sp. WMMD1102]MDG4785906.1 plasmid pRiA4b ORF-3 family protein [Micromonospora sp. WMMD1102]